MSVCGVCSNDPVSFYACFRRIKIWNHNRLCWFYGLTLNFLLSFEPKCIYIFLRVQTRKFSHDRRAIFRTLRPILLILVRYLNFRRFFRFSLNLQILWFLSLKVFLQDIWILRVRRSYFLRIIEQALYLFFIELKLSLLLGSSRTETTQSFIHDTCVFFRVHVTCKSCFGFQQDLRWDST